MAGAGVLAAGPSSTAVAQSRAAAARTPVTIPYLANATKPTDLDFTAAQCDAASNGEVMTCRFRQVFLTRSSVDAMSCVITTNGYEQTLRREGSGRWVSRSMPIGDCGAVQSTILEDGGGTRWTMTIRTDATLGTERSECRAAVQEPEVYDWRGVKRALPCTFIQPGAIER